jgi:hypothetical protein
MTEESSSLFAVPDKLLLGDLEAVIRDKARAHGRSNQVEIGPSSLGQACERRLAMELLGSPKVNDDRDEWTSTVGTALHTWMEGAFISANTALVEAGHPIRWLVEQTVEVRVGLKGHVDVYDLWTNTVLDHKFPGVTSIRKYRKAGNPGRQYIWQAHAYGLGWANMGFPVKSVAIAMYPRSGLVRDTWLWQEPYDPTVAEEALTRVDGLLVAMDIAESMGSLSDYLDLLDRDTDNCGWCPFFDRTAEDPANGCKGPFNDPTYSDGHAMSIPGIIA